MSEKIWNVLFLCSGNSARSIMAESLLNYWGRGRFRAFSAGSTPRASVDPIALDILAKLELPLEGLRAKSWHDYAQADAPVMDFVFTVCDDCAASPAPSFPGNPVRAHWGVPDPVVETGSEVVRSILYREAFRVLESRIKPFVVLRPAALSRVLLKRQVDALGHIQEAAQPAA